MLNFSIAYGKTPVGLSRDWKVFIAEANNWYCLDFDAKTVVTIQF